VWGGGGSQRKLCREGPGETVMQQRRVGPWVGVCRGARCGVCRGVWCGVCCGVRCGLSLGVCCGVHCGVRCGVCLEVC